MGESNNRRCKIAGPGEILSMDFPIPRRFEMMEKMKFVLNSARWMKAQIRFFLLLGLLLLFFLITATALPFQPFDVFKVYSFHSNYCNDENLRTGSMLANPE